MHHEPKSLKHVLFMGYYHSPKPLRRLMLCNVITGIVFLFIWIWMNGGLLPGFAYSYLFPELITPSANLVDFFPLANQDGSKIFWAHGTNTKESMIKAGKDDRVMMVEGEVVLLGQNTAKQSLLPVMLHTGAAIDDTKLTFDEWLSLALEAEKGFKLDFKTIEPVEICLQKLASRIDLISKPILLGANVLSTQYSTEGDYAPVDPQRFLRLTSQYLPSSILVVGWTVDPQRLLRYDWTAVMNMYELLIEKKVKQTISVSVNALLTRESIPQIKWLAELLRASVIVTSCTKDEVNPNDFLFLRNKFPADKVYYDMHHSHAADKGAEQPSQLAADLQLSQVTRFRTEGWRHLKTDFLDSVYMTSEALVLQKGLLGYDEDPYVFTNEPMTIRGRVNMFKMPSDPHLRADLGFTIALHEPHDPQLNSYSGVRCFFGVDGWLKLSTIIQNKADTTPVIQELNTKEKSGCFTFELTEYSNLKVTLKVVYALDCNTMSYFSTFASITHSLELDISRVEFDPKHKFITISASNPYGYVALDVFRVN